MIRAARILNQGFESADRFQFLKCEVLMDFFVMQNSKLNIFGFWADC